MHEAFFFGPEKRQLFGIYHPSLGVDRRVLTLVCPPLFSELNRTHAALRKLSNSLANAGYHVLRFDYSGTGDSYGNLEDVTLDDWREDIATALQEGRELSGCDKVRVLGVRGSCPLVARSVGDNPAVDRLVFWDPVVEGRQYLEELRNGQQELFRQNVFVHAATKRAAKGEYDVYRMSDAMKCGFLELQADAYESIDKSKLRVVTTKMPVRLEVSDGFSDFVDFDCGWGVESEDLVMCQPVLESLMNLSSGQ
jgi:pimeloyl-ACP methyl ester carboxylesterase